MNEKLLIAYEPMADEVDWHGCAFLNNRAADFIVPQDKTADPFAVAQQLTHQFENKKVHILIPGQRFDKTGTRHGRGLGWYDRFLSHVPKEWQRIGVCHAHQIQENLERAVHDEAVDYLWIFDGARWDVCATKAR